MKVLIGNENRGEERAKWEKRYREFTQYKSASEALHRLVEEEAIAENYHRKNKEYFLERLRDLTKPPAIAKQEANDAEGSDRGPTIREDNRGE